MPHYLWTTPRTPVPRAIGGNGREPSDFPRIVAYRRHVKDQRSCILQNCCLKWTEYINLFTMLQTRVFAQHSHRLSSQTIIFIQRPLNLRTSESIENAFPDIDLCNTGHNGLCFTNRPKGSKRHSFSPLITEPTDIESAAYQKTKHWIMWRPKCKQFGIYP